MTAQRYGRIVNIGGEAWRTGAPFHTLLAGVGKGSMVGLTVTLAGETIRDGITVNCLNPGPIDTPLLRDLPPEWLDTKIKELPIGRFGRPEEVAPAALLLASEEGSYFVGASLNMNGGDVMV